MMRKQAFRLVLVAAVLSLAAVTVFAQSNKKPVNWDQGIPEPFHSPSASNRPQVVERPGGANLAIPQGFQVEEFAMDSNWIRPRYMLLLPNGHILMTDSGDRNEQRGTVSPRGTVRIKALHERSDSRAGIDVGCFGRSVRGAQQLILRCSSTFQKVAASHHQIE